MKIYVYDKSGDKESDFDGMSLTDFLIWSLDGARQAYECNLFKDEPEWSDLSDDDKMSLLAAEITQTTPEIEFFIDKYFPKSYTIRADGKYIDVYSSDQENGIERRRRAGFSEEKKGCYTLMKKDNISYAMISEANLFPNETEYVLVSTVGGEDTDISFVPFYGADEARERMVSEYQSLAEDGEDGVLNGSFARCMNKIWKIYKKDSDYQERR